MTENMENCLSAFAAFLHDGEKAPATIKKYLHDIQTMLQNISVPSLRELTHDTVIAYKQSLIQHGYAVHSINSIIASLNTFFSFHSRDDLKLKALKMQKSAFDDGEKELTKDEFTRLCTAAEQTGNQRLLLLLETIGGTGVRVSELKFITVESVNKGRTMVTLKGKTRPVWIVKPLQRKLRQYIRERGITNGAVFVTRRGKPLDRTNIWREMKKLCVLAKVDPHKVFPHNLRHLFAREFYRQEKDIVKLADILGHSDIKTTRIYIAFSESEHIELLERMRLVV